VAILLHVFVLVLLEFMLLPVLMLLLVAVIVLVAVVVLVAVAMLAVATKAFGLSCCGIGMEVVWHVVGVEIVFVI